MSTGVFHHAAFEAFCCMLSAVFSTSRFPDGAGSVPCVSPGGVSMMLVYRQQSCCPGAGSFSLLGDEHLPVIGSGRVRLAAWALAMPTGANAAMVPPRTAAATAGTSWRTMAHPLCVVLRALRAARIVGGSCPSNGPSVLLAR